jgi:YD repeat-containing protein
MTYDAIGNLISKTGVGAYQYGSNLNGTGVGPYQARKVNGATYSYDRNGNMQSGGAWSYTWNADNTLASMTNGTAPESYQYDADGERVVRTAGGVTPMFSSEDHSERGSFVAGRCSAAGSLSADVARAGASTASAVSTVSEVARP